MNAAQTARLAANMTVREASEASGVAAPTIYALEREEWSPSVATLVKLSRAYGCAWWSVCPQCWISSPEVTR